MARYHRHGVQSTAAIAGHPLHHILVVFPVAFLMGALVTDLALRGTGDPFWARASYYLLGAGIVTALVAAIPGFVDFFTIDRARNIWVSWAHMALNLVVVALAVVNFWIRREDAVAGGMGWGLTLSVLIALILLASGWLGGELAYRYGLGSIEDDSPEVEQFYLGTGLAQPTDAASGRGTLGRP